MSESREPAGPRDLFNLGRPVETRFAVLAGQEKLRFSQLELLQTWGRTGRGKMDLHPFCSCDFVLRLHVWSLGVSQFSARGNPSTFDRLSPPWIMNTYARLFR